MTKRSMPVWNAKQYVLTLGRVRVKQFTAVAPCQEAILAAFERAGWPAAIPAHRLERLMKGGKKGLRQTVSNLRRSCTPYLTFGLQRNGSRITWAALAGSGS